MKQSILIDLRRQPIDYIHANINELLNIQIALSGYGSKLNQQHCNQMNGLKIRQLNYNNQNNILYDATKSSGKKIHFQKKFISSSARSSKAVSPATMEKGSPKLNISLSRVAQHDKSQLNLNNSIQASPVVQSLNRKNLVMHIENCSRSVQLLGSPLKRVIQNLYQYCIN
ncbi:hypothetical protein TTHERM_000316609 (macronuclear) [Tetrahymena thermophila SB210]|uniref:Uncharacterized protein n=1 Tax=Tetrahymena thermophila (strain SB210) TaxID=312017 RepID=W7X1F7_TETTS|nr:hypothetical protein TTHERM_000316609 [Tetrahymena thermophila SB210]EWS73075.1 hypothetical protein TTHERM_000316609 [Tetrahymena thermophila SB210]|eukprot:XP_012654384.1 hypothetical protein TTHERM_000316609 [Tetrahymena thermophila SB210]